MNIIFYYSKYRREEHQRSSIEKVKGTRVKPIK